MKIIILGSGTDVSQLSDIPNRYPPGFLVEWGREKILFEASEGVRFRLEQAGYDYTEIHHLAISHSHPDHYALVQYYQSVHNNLQWSGRYEKEHELSIYCPKYIAENFWQLWRFYQPNYPDGLKPPKLNFFSMPPLGEIEIAGAKLSAVPVFHGGGRVEAIAFRLEFQGKIFVYSGDTGMCEGIKKVAEHADLFICEASAPLGSSSKALAGYGHLSPKEVGEIAKEANVKKVILVHYIGFDSEQTMIADCRRGGFKGEIVVGKDFLEFEV